MDILRVLSAPDHEVRKKTLNLALDLVTSRMVEEVGTTLALISSLSDLAFIPILCFYENSFEVV